MDNNSANAFAGLFASGFILTIFVFLIAITAFFVWLFWRIFAKAGYNGALGLLCLIPTVGPLICLIVLAFGTWPVENRSSS